MSSGWDTAAVGSGLATYAVNPALDTAAAGSGGDEPVAGGVDITTGVVTAVNSGLCIAAVDLGLNEPEAAVDTGVPSLEDWGWMHQKPEWTL